MKENLTPEERQELEDLADESPYSKLFKHTSYKIKDNRFFREYEKEGETIEQYLGNFFLIAESETTRDNGIDRDKVFQLKAVCEGIEQSSEYIAAKDYNSMNFIPQTWGIALRPAVGQNIMAYYRDSIGAQSKNVKRENVYTHTGWRKIGDKWAFLHAGGAIGADGVRVELDGRLSRYELKHEADPTAAIKYTLNLFKLAPKEIMYPLVGMAFLSPLNEFMRQAGVEPAFSFYLLGVTSAGKSTLAAIVLSLFGDFGNKSLPASFKDTANSLEKKGFLLKDVLTVIDDFHPVSSRQEAAKMQVTAQAIARMYGDRTGRERLNADTVLRQGYAPRGNAIITGEDLPDIASSGVARYAIVEVERGDVNLPLLLEMDDNKDTLSACMGAYIEWLIPQAAALPRQLKEQFIGLRESAKDDDRHGRIAEHVAHLQIGLLTFLSFLEESHIIDEAKVQSVADDSWKLLIDMAEKQSRRMEEEKPTQMMMTALSELLATSQVYTTKADEQGVHGNGFIGYHDEECYYLYSETVYKNVMQFYAAQGRNFPVTKNTLLKNLCLEGISICDKGSSMKQKRIGKAKRKYLCISKDILSAE